MHKFLLFLFFLPLNASLIELPSPTDGFIEKVFVQEGDAIQMNKLLVQLVNPYDSLKALDLESLIADKMQKLEQLVEVGSVNEVQYQEAIEQKLHAFSQRKELLEADLVSLNADYLRKENLLRSGLVDLASVTSAKEHLEEKQKDLSLLNDSIAKLQQELQQCPKSDEALALESEIASLNIELLEIQKKIEKQQLYSPYKATVKEIYFLSGEHVLEGEPLLQIEY